MERYDRTAIKLIFQTLGDDEMGEDAWAKQGIPCGDYYFMEKRMPVTNYLYYLV